MKNSSKFFRNHECEYFPCHKQPAESEFNCMFCYCPLYAMGDKCGGVFEYVKGVKSCMDCHLVHVPEYYHVVMSKLTEKALEDSANA